MNLKDRLNNTKKPKKKTDKKNNSLPVETVSYEDLFADEENVKKILSDLINKDRNLIVVCDKSIDTTAAAYYMKYIAHNKKTSVIKEINNGIFSEKTDFYLVDNPDINDIVKIFELIILGYKSFIFTLKLNNFNNIIEKLKTIIAINFKNLTEENINILLSSSEPAFVCISKNEDGLYYISSVRCLNYDFNGFYLKILYDYTGEIQNNYDKPITQKNENVQEEHLEKQVKINKYKLLKEKYKNKNGL